jgi:alkaline phosphatase D
MLNPLSPHEAFASYPREHAALLQWIRDCRIPGVLFLSGDRHHTELIRLEDSTFYPLYDYTSSPLTSSTGVSESERNNPLRVPGTWVNDVRNFGLLKFDGSRKDRRLTMECYNKDGVLLWSHTVRARELVPPDKK